nr:hypothetical protein [Tanacetum cinerariifolium]
MLVIWNPSIGKSFGIALPSFNSKNPLVFGFGVCPVTRDPTVVKIIYAFNKPWLVEVFSLSSGVWNVIPSDFSDDGESTTNLMVVSFDLITKEFKVVNLPDTLKNKLLFHVSVSKLRGSLVVSGYIMVEGALSCGVWLMEHDLSFRKLFNIGASFYNILGFRKNGEPVFKIQKANEQFTTLNV